VSDQSSIERIGEHESILEFPLVKTLTHAQNLADFYLKNNSVPKTIITFSEPIKKILCEVGDCVILRTSFSNINIFLGTVIRIEKIFTSEDSVSVYKFTIAGRLENNSIIENNISTETVALLETTPSNQIASGFGNTPWGRSWGF
jgi:hypothetical protein